MTVRKTQQTLSTTLEKTEQALDGLENGLDAGRKTRDTAGTETTNPAGAHPVRDSGEGNAGLPEGWTNCLVGDYLFLKNGYAFKSNMYTEKGESTFPIIRISDVDGRIASDVKAIHVKSENVVAGFEVHDGDLLIAMSGATTGKVGIYKGDLAYQNQRVGNIKLHSEKLGNKEYKNYLIANLTPDILKAAYGGAQPNISGKAIEGIQIPLPPLAEQTVIAQTLDTLLAQVDNIKTRLDAIPKILKTFRQSVLAAAVSGKLTEAWRGENDVSFESWKFDKAEEVCEKVQSGSTPRDNPFDQGGDIPFLKVYNIVDQKISFDYKPQFVTTEVHEKKLKRSIAKPNDVLMNIVGPPLGKVAILTDQYPEWNLNQAITLFRVDEAKYLARLLYFVLCEGDLVRKVMPDTKGSVGQVNISLTQCREAVIPVPSVQEQTEIVRRVEELFTFADQIEQQVKNAQGRVNNLTQSILAKAFRGELTAQWRAQNPDLITGDNSAEALLAKIQEKREALKKSVKPKKAPKKKATAKKSAAKKAEEK